MGPQLIISNNIKAPLSQIKMQAGELAEKSKRICERLDRKTDDDKLSDNEWREIVGTTREISDFVDRSFVLQRNLPIGYDWFGPHMIEKDAWGDTEDLMRRAYFCLMQISEYKNDEMPSCMGATRDVLSNKVFVVHGHDDSARESVARVISLLGLYPVILHEQANRGATLIEKFERNADVGFAVIILTPDDDGRNKGVKAFSDRARQNVVLELGYFVGRLGRERVMVLISGEIELPSDVLGIVYERFDKSGAWRFALGRELRSAGYDVDLNKLV